MDAETINGPSRFRILIVDDQGFMRMALRQIIDGEPDMIVVGEAANGHDAIRLARELKPDIVTMDVEMPLMDGCEATLRILKDTLPKPAIIMISSHTQLGAEATLKALKAGAVDFISKTTMRAFNDFTHIGSELRLKIRAWGRTSILRQTGSKVRFGETTASERVEFTDLVVVASSTGGPQALSRLFTASGRIAPPVIVAQHMPAFFTAGLARMLTEDAGVLMTEGRNGDMLQPGSVTILPGGLDGMIMRKAPGVYELRIIRLESNPHPSANALFESAAISASAPLGVVLTGMGDDGTKGSLALRRRGATIIAQTPDSCVVDGMPKSVIDAQAATQVLPLERIGAVLGAAQLRRATSGRDR